MLDTVFINRLEVTLQGVPVPGMVDLQRKYEEVPDPQSQSVILSRVPSTGMKDIVSYTLNPKTTMSYRLLLELQTLIPVKIPRNVTHRVPLDPIRHRSRFPTESFISISLIGRDNCLDIAQLSVVPGLELFLDYTEALEASHNVPAVIFVRRGGQDLGFVMISLCDLGGIGWLWETGLNHSIDSSPLGWIRHFGMLSGMVWR